MTGPRHTGELVCIASVDPSTQASPPPGRAEDAQLRRKLERCVAKACPPWAQSHRDDIVQAAMLRMMRARDKRAGEQLPSSYLWKVAYTATIDEVRRLRAKREVAIDDEAAGQVPDPGVSPEDRARADQIAQGLRDCLTRLIETRRQAVSLYLAGHSVPDSGRILGWTTKRTENLVYRGLTDLRTCLTNKGLQP